MFHCSYDGCESDDDSSSIESDHPRDASSNAVELADNFECLMDRELSRAVASVCKSYITPSASGGSTTIQKHISFGNTSTMHVNDSDDEAESADETDKPNGIDPTEDEELFYDPLEDDENAAWVSNNLPGGNSHNSDAILNCPSCMTVLSLESKKCGCRNRRLKNCYRSVHPIHCVVDRNAVQHSPFVADKKGSKKRRACTSNTSNVVDGEGGLCTQAVENQNNVYGVNCEVCGAEVGLQDLNQTVYFINVLTSHC